MKLFYVYIIASERNGTLYIGVTSDLPKRISEHKEGVFEGFSKKYKLDRLVYYEIHEMAEEAFTRETQLKNWKRARKLKLIEQFNSSWDDLFEKII